MNHCPDILPTSVYVLHKYVLYYVITGVPVGLIYGHSYEKYRIHKSGNIYLCNKVGK